MSMPYNFFMGRNKNLIKRFGLKLRYLRNLQGLSQIQLAEKANLNFNFIGQIERAEANPSLKTITAIANALDIDVKDFFEFTF